MNFWTRYYRLIALSLTLLLMSQAAHAGVCLMGECNAMTTEFRNLELRPKSIALLPAHSSLKQKGVFSSDDLVGETAILEKSLGDALEKRISALGYEVRRVTLEQVQEDAKLATLVNNANQRYDEEYSKIIVFKLSGVKYRRYSVGEQARLLATYLGVDAIAYPRMQAVGATGAGIMFSPTGGGQINMEFGLTHVRTGDIEAFFGAINTGGLFGKSISSILEKPDKHMQKIAKTATKRMPKVGAALRPQKLKHDQIRELQLFDVVDEELIIDDLEGLLDEE